MKYKITGAVTCVAALLLALFIPFLIPKSSDRVHQHLQAEEKKVCNHDSKDEFCTHLPLVKINTDGVEIPGKIMEKEVPDAQEEIEYTLAADGTTTIRAQIDVIDNEGVNNHVDDTSAVSSDIQIRVRGNSSRLFDKSSYAIRLVNEDGSNNAQNIMGMDAHHEWVLYGPYLDKTLLRNYMWYNIAGEIMDYAPNVRFCELMLNGSYQGLYVMTENITAGKDGARLGLSVNKKTENFSGYLLRLDIFIEANDHLMNNFTNYTYRNGTSKMEVIYPGKRNLTRKTKEEICRDFSDFEKALYSYDYDNNKYGYRNYIDVKSFIDYFLINELTCNYDAGGKSTYIYKGMDNFYRMCIWDFNSACDNYQEKRMESDIFYMQSCLWFEMLIKDEDFVEQLIDRYWMLRETYFSEEYLEQYIDDVTAYLGDAIDRNFEVWGYTFSEEHNLLVPDERNLRSYPEAVEQMKFFLEERIAWMDENIDILRQYSAESRVKKFNENAN